MPNCKAISKTDDKTYFIDSVHGIKDCFLITHINATFGHICFAQEKAIQECFDIIEDFNA